MPNPSGAWRAYLVDPSRKYDLAGSRPDFDAKYISEYFPHSRCSIVNDVLCGEVGVYNSRASTLRAWKGLYSPVLVHARKRHLSVEMSLTGYEVVSFNNGCQFDDLS